MDAFTLPLFGSTADEILNEYPKLPLEHSSCSASERHPATNASKKAYRTPAASP
jgi:hypothetical protein